MHLIDVSCKKFQDNGTHVIFPISFQGCGTARITSKHTVTYFNEVLRGLFGRPTDSLNDLHNVRFPVKCSYGGKRQTLSALSYKNFLKELNVSKGKLTFCHYISLDSY